MNTDEARDALAFAENAQKRAREDIARPWLPLVLLASMSVASLALTNSATTPSGLFWIFAGPLAAAAIAVYAYRRGKTSGLESSPLAYVGIALGLLILALAAGRVAFAFEIPALGRVGPPLVVAAGYLVLARIEHSRLVAAVAVALIAASALTVGFGLSAVQSNSILFVIYGLTFLAVGFGLRVRRPQLP
jgi:hypothetical protein